jgi:hypothetical protein
VLFFKNQNKEGNVMIKVLFIVLMTVLQVSFADSLFAKDIVYTYSMSKDSEATRTKKNTYFEASITPSWRTGFKAGGFLGLGLKETGGTSGCESFILTLKNISNKDISIVWDKTLFIDNTQTRGTFMFEGIRYIDRDASKPSDLVLAGGTLKKEIHPNILVFYASGQYGGWRNELMREGVYGVYLTSEVDGKPITEKLLITIQKDELPQNEK